MTDHISDPDEPTQDYLRDYDHNAEWSELENQQEALGRERDERLYGEVINE
jgi:hypothetical protein